MNKNQKLILTVGYIVLLSFILISPPAFLNPTRYGGYYQAIKADTLANILRTGLAGLILLGWYAFKDKRSKIQK